MYAKLPLKLRSEDHPDEINVRVKDRYFGKHIEQMLEMSDSGLAKKRLGNILISGLRSQGCQLMVHFSCIQRGCLNHQKS
jgi:hypothetical protein